MPRNIDPGTLNVGTGLAAADSIEANALVHPTGGNDGLRVHILDPSRAHEARAVHVVDALNLFASDHVEGALEEIAASTSAGRVNGVIEGGLFTASSGLTFELDATTTLLLGGTGQDFSGQQVALAMTTTQFVYVDTGTGLLTASGVAPLLSTEPILIAEVTTNGVGITSSRDLRFFVYNIDRKLALTVRSAGGSGNARSEANFITLEAALTYLELYAGSGTAPVETHLIKIRGDITIGSTVAIPVDGVIFEGDGTGQFVDATGGSTMFAMGNMDRTQFHNLTFTANDPGTIALSGGEATQIVVEGCQFLADGDSFGTIATLNPSAAAGTQFRMSNCIAFCYSGIDIERPSGCRIENTRFTGAGGAAGTDTCFTSTVGGLPAGIGRTVIQGVRADGFLVCINSEDIFLTVKDTEISDVATGIIARGDGPTLTNVTLTMDVMDGLSGIAIHGDRGVVTDCRITNPRTVWAGSSPIGIAFTSSVDSVVSGCLIDGFLDTSNSDGVGINMVGVCPGIRISDTMIRTVAVGVEILSGGSDSVQVNNCTIEDAGVGIRSVGTKTLVSDTNITLSTSDTGAGAEVGIQFGGQRSNASNCNVDAARVAWTVGAVLPIGLFVNAGFCTVSDCRVEGFYNDTDDLGFGINVGGVEVTIDGCTIDGAKTGITTSATNKTNISGVTIQDVEMGIYNRSSDSVITGCFVDLSTTRGLVGMEMATAQRIVVGDCRFKLTRTFPGANTDVPHGILVTGGLPYIQINNVLIDGFWNNDADVGRGIYADSSNIRVQGATIRLTHTGMFFIGAEFGTLDNCIMKEMSIGVEVQMPDVTISNCNIELSSIRAQYGILADDKADRLKVLGNQIECARVAWGTDPTRPLGVACPFGNSVNDVNISNNSIRGFKNTFNDTGRGIEVDASNCIITGNRITGSPDGIYSVITGLGSNLTIDNCFIFDAFTGITVDGTAGNATATNLSISNTVIDLDIDGGIIGINIPTVLECSITTCKIRNPRTVYGGADDPIGISLAGVRASVSDTNITGFTNDGAGPPRLGKGILVSGFFLSVSGVNIDNAGIGIDASGALTTLRIDGATIFNVRQGILTNAQVSLFEGVNINTDADDGLNGIMFGVSTAESAVSNCNIRSLRASWAGSTSTPYGIRCEDDEIRINNTLIEKFYNTNNASGYGISIEEDEIAVSDCTIRHCWKGIAADLVAVADISISDNTVDGYSDGCSLGISIVPPTGDTTKNVQISGNYVTGVADAGINIRRRVRDVNITGNQVDGQILDGANPTAIGIWLRSGVSGTTDFPRFNNITGNTVLQCASGIVVEGSLNTEAAKITITGNTVHNCATSWAGGSGDEEDYNNVSRGIHVVWTNRATIVGNTVTEIGSSFVAETGSPGGAPNAFSEVLPNGIRVELCTGVTVTGNTISNSVFSGNSGEGTGILIAQWNGDSGNQRNRGTVVADNTITTTGDFGIRVVCMEGNLTPTTHEITQLSIKGNTVRNVNLNHIGFQAGELPSASNTSLISGVVVEGNLTYAALAAGEIPTQVTTLSGVLAGDTLTLTHVSSGKAVVFTASAGAPTFGSGQFDISGSDTSDATNLAEAINTSANWPSDRIRPLRAVATGSDVAVFALEEGQSTAIYNVTSSNGARLDTVMGIVVNINGHGYIDGPAHIFIDGQVGDIQNLTVSNNNLTCASSESGTELIKLWSQGNKASASIKGVYIDGNTLEGENSTASAGVVVRIENNAPEPAGLSICRNRIRQMARVGVYIYSDLNTEDFQNLSINDNQFEDIGWCAVVGDLNDSIKTLSVSRNEFYAPVATETMGLFWQWGHLGTSLSSPALVNGKFDDNSFSLIADHTLRVVQYRDDTSAVVIRNVSINRNQFERCAGTDENMHTLFFQNSGHTRNLQANANQFNDCAADQGRPQIEVVLDGEGKDYTGIDIVGNQSRQAGGAGILLDLFGDGGGDPAEASFLRVNDNLLYDGGPSTNDQDAIEVSLGSGVTISQVEVCRNIIEDNSFDDGIFIDGNNTAQFYNLRVNDNNIRDMNGSGIYINACETSGTNSARYQISRNLVTNCDEHGIALVAVRPGITMVNGPNFGLQNCQIQDNQLIANGTAGSYHGLRVRWEPDLDTGSAVFQYFICTGNLVRSHGINAGTTYIVGGTSPNGGDHGFSFRVVSSSWTGVIISNNQAANCAGYGFFFDLGIDSRPERYIGMAGITKYHAGSASASFVMTGNVATNNDSGAQSQPVTYSSGGSGNFQVGAYGTNWDINNDNGGWTSAPTNFVCTSNTASSGGGAPNAVWNDIDDGPGGATWLGSVAPSATGSWNEVG